MEVDDEGVLAKIIIPADSGSVKVCSGYSFRLYWMPFKKTSVFDYFLR
jgi:hypothetical protein